MRLDIRKHSATGAAARTAPRWCAYIEDVADDMGYRLRWMASRLRHTTRRGGAAGSGVCGCDRPSASTHIPNADCSELMCCVCKEAVRDDADTPTPFSEGELYDTPLYQAWERFQAGGGNTTSARPPPLLVTEGGGDGDDERIEGEDADECAEAGEGDKDGGGDGDGNQEWVEVSATVSVLGAWKDLADVTDEDQQQMTEAEHARFLEVVSSYVANCASFEGRDY